MTIANTTIHLKKSGVSGNIPSSLEHGELAINFYDGKLYYKNADDEITYISSGVPTNSFATINANSSLILASSNNDTLTIAAGNNITISACTSTKTITINSQDADVDQFARDTGNSAVSLAQEAYNYANTISGGAAIDNVARTLAQSAYNQSNDAITFAQSSYNQSNVYIGVNATQNTRLNSIETVNSNQNTSISIIEGVNAWQNNEITYVNQFAQSAYDKANTGVTSAEDPWARENSNAAFIQANAAITVAQNAYDEANTKLPLTGGVITGDLHVEGFANVDIKLTVGIGTYEVLPNCITQFTGTSDFYSQVNQQNLSGDGTGDFVITASNGTDTINYIDMGIAGHTYNNTTYNAFSFVNPNDGYNLLIGNPSQSFGGNVFYGTSGSGFGDSQIGDIVFIQGQNFDEVARWKLGEGLVIEYETPSTSTTTGTLQVRGGLGVTGSIYGGNIYDNGTRILTYNQGVNTTQNNNIIAVNNFAQNAYNKANAAYNYANTISGGGGGGGSYNQSLNTTDPVIFSSVTTNVVYISNSSFYAANATFTTTDQQTLDTFELDQFRTSKYLIQSVSGADVHSTEILVMHNDVNAFVTQYANTYTLPLIGINALVDSANNLLNVFATPFYENTLVDFVRTAIVSRPVGGLFGDLMSQSGTEDLNTGSGTEDLNL